MTAPETPAETEVCGHVDCAAVNGYLDGTADAYTLAAWSLRARAEGLPAGAWAQLMSAADELERRAEASRGERFCWQATPTHGQASS